MAVVEPKALCAAFLDAAGAKRPISHLAVAVSGGSDSTALLLFVAGWAKENGIRLSAVTVDHGLRRDATQEARQVADLCKGLSVSHHTLRWDEEPQGNLQAAARTARYGLITNWACQQDVDAVALGHTENDQAETTLLRLLRGSGVDGLAAMRSDWVTDGLRWLRPLLCCTRDALRNELASQDQAWTEDPSNSDTRFDRVKARQALVALADLGISQDGLVATSVRLSKARAALEQATHEAVSKCVVEDRGTLLTDMASFNMQSEDVQDRLLAHGLCWISGHIYRPRFQALSGLKQTIQQGGTGTLHGCMAISDGTQFRIFRELSAVQGQSCQPDEDWDNRWSFAPVASAEHHLACLGEDGILQIGNWRDSGLPRAVLLSAPALWLGDELIACPHARFGTGFSLKDRHDNGGFAAAIRTV